MYVGIGMNTPHVVDFATISLTILGVHVPHGEGERHGACYRAWYRVEWWAREGHLAHMCGEKEAINRGGMKSVISFDKTSLSLSLHPKSQKPSPSLPFFCSQNSPKNSPKTAPKTAQKQQHFLHENPYFSLSTPHKLSFSLYTRKRFRFHVLIPPRNR